MMPKRHTPQHPTTSQMRNTAIKTRRLFIALLPDKKTVDKLAALQSTVNGRKSPSENLHLTLMFLGGQPPARITELREFLKSLTFRPFDLTIDRMGFFSRLKICWAGSTKTPPELTELHNTICSYLADDTSVVSELSRPFRPHITLARKSNPTETPIPAPFTWHITRLALMESIISTERGKSSTYKILYEKQAEKPDVKL
jgi:2'-5' RNA ligase